MQEILDHCKRAMGSAPRWLIRDRFSYLRVQRPDWMREMPDDRMKILFANYGRAFTRGTIVWGHVVQANNILFSNETDFDAPGEVVYSLTDTSPAIPLFLEKIARQLFSLKGTAPRDPQLQPIAAYLTDEMIRVFGLSVPKSISPKAECRISTTYFVRKHLPERRIMTPLMPLCVLPHEPFVAMPVPFKYWPPDWLDMF